VHEHWNNADDKQYSRNLGSGEGIELYRVWLATAVGEKVNPLPQRASLEKNYPNPFREVTTILFTLNHATRLSIDIYDPSGCRIENLVSTRYPAGSFTLQWDAGEYPAGIYFCRLTTREHIAQTIKLQKIQ
jgi:hypothetical protein